MFIINDPLTVTLNASLADRLIALEHCLSVRLERLTQGLTIGGARGRRVDADLIATARRDKLVLIQLLLASLLLLLVMSLRLLVLLVVVVLLLLVLLVAARPIVLLIARLLNRIMLLLELLLLLLLLLYLIHVCS